MTPRSAAIREVRYFGRKLTQQLMTNKSIKTEFKILPIKDTDLRLNPDSYERSFRLGLEQGCMRMYAAEFPM